MVHELKHGGEGLLKKLGELRVKLYKATVNKGISSNKVINTVALSNEITSELKEIIIILHTTMVDELTEAKVTNFDINTEIISVTEEIISLQNEVISRLSSSNNSTSSTKTMSATTIELLKDYKATISLMLVIGMLWVLVVISPSAMNTIFTALPDLLRSK